MKTAVIFSSRKGYVKEVAEKIKQGLGDNAALFDLGKTGKIDTAGYDNIVIAGSVAAGRFSSKVKKYLHKNPGALSGKKSFLLSAGLDDKDYMGMLKNNFTEETLKAFSGIVYCGGRYIPEMHNPVIRKIMSRINGAEGAIHKEKPENIDKLIKELK